MTSLNKTEIGGSIRLANSVSGSAEIPRTIYKEELVFKNYHEFPAVGNDGFLYAATDENAIYRFDSQNLIYICIGRDYNQIETVQCILRKEEN